MSQGTVTKRHQNVADMSPGVTGCHNKSFGVTNIHTASHFDQHVDMLTQTGQAGGFVNMSSLTFVNDLSLYAGSSDLIGVLN